MHYTKKKKISGIVTVALLVASVAGLIAFSATGNIFNTSNYYATTNEATFSIRADEPNQPHPAIDEVKGQLNKIYVNGNAQLTYGDVTYFEYSTVEGDKHNPTTFYHQTYKIVINEKDITSPIFSFGEGSENREELVEVIKEAMNEKFNVEDADEAKGNQPRVYSNVVYNIPSNVGAVVLSTIISLVTFTVYLLIRRFRASRVLSVFITSAVGATLSLGFISLTRVVATPVLSVSMALTMLVTVMMSLFILHKDKDLIKEERMKDVATRKVVLKKANAMALLPMLIFALISVYAAINFFGFGHKEFLALFFSSAFGMAMSVVILLTWFTPMCDMFDERFSRVKLPQLKTHKKDKAKVKSNTPEEAIFIGIND
ncbi:MAG: hypothetical protein MJ199_02555 [Bacilli bacterium]|nr:hypothetical protein [Bacilli bacterium]